MQASPLIPEYFNHPQKETPCPLAVTCHLTPSPWEPRTHFLCGFVSMSLRLCLLWAWSHTTCGLSCPAALTQHQVFECHPHCSVWQSSLPRLAEFSPLYRFPMFYCPSISGWALGLFPPLSVVSDAAANTAVQVFLCKGARFPFLRIGVVRGGALDL